MFLLHIPNHRAYNIFLLVRVPTRNTSATLLGFGFPPSPGFGRPVSIRVLLWSSMVSVFHGQHLSFSLFIWLGFGHFKPYISVFQTCRISGFAAIFSFRGAAQHVRFSGFLVHCHLPIWGVTPKDSDNDHDDDDYDDVDDDDDDDDDGMEMLVVMVMSFTPASAIVGFRSSRATSASCWV